MASKSDYTPRAKALLESLGFMVGKVEYWSPYPRPGKRHDLFGFIDLVGIHPRLPGVLAIQTTDHGHHAARIKKIKEECREQCENWLRSQNPVWVVTWGKGANGRWYPRATALRLARAGIGTGDLSPAIQACWKEKREPLPGELGF